MTIRQRSLAMFRTAGWRACLLAMLAGAAGPAGADQQRETAHFVVTDRIVTPDLPVFGTNLSGLGNGRRFLPGGNFEPIIFRNMFLATGGSERRILAAPRDLSHYDSWRGRAFEGADVEVLRIENGAFRSVRRDRVAPGGYHASGWSQQLGGQVVEPDRTGVDVVVAPWSRADTIYHFTVRSVGRGGRLSPPADAVAVPYSKPEQVPDESADGLIDIELGRERRGLAPPATLRGRQNADGSIRLEWDPVPGARGYAVYRSDIPPDRHEGYSIDLDREGDSVRAGDLVILRARLLRTDQEALLTNRVWNAGGEAALFRHPLLEPFSDIGPGSDWSLVQHDPESPVREHGDTFLRVTLAPGTRLPVGRYTDSGTGQSWWPVLHPGMPYRFEVWMRGKALTQVSFSLPGAHRDAIAPHSFRVTPEWKLYSFIFTPKTLFDGTGVNRMELMLTGPGTFDIDNLRVYRDDAPYMAFLPEDFERLEESRMSPLRTHGLIKTGRRSYDLAQLTSRGLYPLLGEIDRLGAEPWIQIEPHLAPEEWRGLVEYLAAPEPSNGVDAEAAPWAEKRVAQGHADPWTDHFERIYFELGNETWNRLFEPWIFPEMKDATRWRRYDKGEVYELYQEHVLSQMRQSPYWDLLAPKLVPVIGGWAGFDYGMKAASVSPSSQFLTHTGYIGGWEQKVGPTTPTPESLFGVLTNVLRSKEPYTERYVADAAEAAAARGLPVELGIYEGGPGYVKNGLNGRKVTEAETRLQELAMKGAAAGTATLDTFLSAARHGMRLQAFFLYADGDHWASHAKWYRGGATFPSWYLLALFNRVGTGDMLDVETLEMPTGTVRADRDRAPIESAPMVAAYATRKADRVTLFLVSRRVPGYPDPADDGVSSVLVDLPLHSARKVTRYRQSGEWNSANVDGRVVRTVAETLSAEDFVPQLSVPDLGPAATEVFVFEGVE
ncbi:hypothetical protein [Tropicimonas sp. IMCC6043]|uniref:hypothetical protein n=1 Tax=Tropicimonas sp. IMCC6043 TaxID=2510645 RepID=UPI00101C05E0|nr:hypothetical protein [Tropicimonas sp. IMCC6043]RYH10993.1 hypothetical protein EU800_07030 [Tropicimonas sp. IMCC6043]